MPSDDTLDRVRQLVKGASAATDPQCGQPPMELYAEVGSLALVAIAETLVEIRDELAELRGVILRRP